MLWELLTFLSYAILLCPFVFFFGFCDCDCDELPCTIASDPFTRADDSEPGEEWVERDGDWAIVSNQLDPPATGLITFVPTYTGDANGLRWAGTFNFGGAAGVARFIVDYVDANNYHYAELNCSSFFACSLRVFKRTGGVNTALGSIATQITGFNWNTPVSLAVCWDGELLQSTANSLYGNDALTTPHGGSLVGLATSGVGSNARFDSVELSRLRSDCAKCPDVIDCDNCIINTLPRYLRGVIAGVVNGSCNDCGGHNGTYLMQNMVGGTSFAPPDCSFGGFWPACQWWGGQTAAICLTARNSPRLFLAKSPTNEYFLIAALTGTVTDPTELSQNSPHWRLSLGVFTTPPNCDELFDNTYVLPYYCEWPEDPGGLTCGYTNSTFTVSKP